MSEKKRSDALRPLTELISLAGRRAIVTGAASGIGRAIALRFAEAGASLVLVDVDMEGLQSLETEMKGNTAPELHLVDLSDKTAIDRFWESLEGGPPDILVNNAGIYPFKDFLEVDEEFLRKVMDTNLSSVLWMSQHMIRRRIDHGGVIINVASIEAILPFMDHLSHYGASKAGVIALSRGLARDYGKKGFRVNVLVPGGIMTPGTMGVAKSIANLNFGLLKSGLEFRQRLPLRRAGKPDEIARMALVLASDLSSYVHGAVIPVDGGFLSA
jgi:NAD(P)-dependent dehydrogenase (short-subunit alcohol dehydrogenase family)